MSEHDEVPDELKDQAHTLPDHVWKQVQDDVENGGSSDGS